MNLATAPGSAAPMPWRQSVLRIKVCRDEEVLAEFHYNNINNAYGALPRG